MTDLDALYRAHARDLRAFAYRRTGDPEMAADLVHEAFAKYAAAVGPQPDARAVEQPRPFLRRTIVNMVIDAIRHRERRGRQASLDEVPHEPVDRAALPDNAITARQDLDRLRATLDGLPERERDALLLNRLHGLTHAEIARRMEVSPSMVSKYIMSALRRLKDRLPRDGA